MCSIYLVDIWYDVSLHAWVILLTWITSQMERWRERERERERERGGEREREREYFLKIKNKVRNYSFVYGSF